MLRFPNPSSTISNFVAVYRVLFENLNGQVVGLDDFVEIVVSANLAASSGYLGKMAISLSTQKDRSLDPLYNQLKMYAELFRLLGWIHPTEERALKYTFTLLGHQIVVAGDHYLPLLGECVLGISYPNNVLTTKGNQDVRPFGLILRSMLACNEALSRDEMIIGPLSADTDRKIETLQNIANKVFELRENSSFVREALETVASRRNVKVNTLKNYTRWPIAIMRDLGWTEKDRLQFRENDQNFEAHKLTRNGKQIVNFLSSSNDIRTDQIDELEWKQKAAISTYAHYSMLERSGFDTRSVSSMLDISDPVLKGSFEEIGVDPAKNLIYSPFQTLSIADIGRIFPPQTASLKQNSQRPKKTTIILKVRARDHLFIKPNLVHHICEDLDNQSKLPLISQIRSLCKTNKLIEQAAFNFANDFKATDKDIFYPSVCELFQILGFESEMSRFGVNYARWDACLISNGLTIPIEIKSPSEEEYLSTKAIRQAVENKIIVLARKEKMTNFNATSLIVGYRIPNERGNLSMLIDDVFHTFGINIGVIDFFTLSQLAFKCVMDNLSIKSNQVTNLRGYLCVSHNPS